MHQYKERKITLQTWLVFYFNNPTLNPYMVESGMWYKTHMLIRMIALSHSLSGRELHIDLISDISRVATCRLLHPTTRNYMLALSVHNTCMRIVFFL